MSSPKNYWASNLKFLRHRLSLNQDNLAANLGITRSKLNAHENGKTVNPPIEDLIRFSEYFRFSIDTLIKVDLASLSEPAIKELEAGNDTYAKGTRLRVLATTIDLNNRENIELVPARARAGYTAGYGDPEFISKLPVFSLPVLPKDRKYRAFPIQGDSMHPVPDGAHIIAEYLEDWLSLKQPTACIVVTRNEGIVFKMASLRPGSVKKLRLESLNWQYDPYEVSIEDVLEIWRFRSMLTDVLPEAETPAEQMNRMVQEMRADVKKLLKK